MQIQDLSYDLNNDKITIDLNPKINLSVELFSFENVYVPQNNSYIKNNNKYFTDKLVWGDNERVKGSINVSVNKCDAFTVEAHTELYCPIRAVKIRLDNIIPGELINSIDCDKNITEKGLLISYPEGWRSLSTPLLVFKLNSKKYFYLRVLDKTVGQKRFFIKKINNKMRIDVVVEKDSSDSSNIFDIPKVEFNYIDNPEEIYSKQSDYIKETYKLPEYKESSIVPQWFRKISLVVTVHMEAFTGHIFNTYDSAYENIKKLTKYIPGNRILVYLAGWEGRYYYDYGSYKADSRLGGEKKLKNMVDNMHKLGCKVMAMYGMNMANKDFISVKNLYLESEIESISGAKFHSGSVDWDGCHHYDFNGLVHLNIGNPRWADYLFNQIESSTSAYGFDGAFLDIAAGYTHDKNYDIYEGVVNFCNRLRTIKPDFLVSGEGFYDGLAKAMPLFQSGHTDGWLHYHDRVSPLLFTRFAREFAHLCLGDPSEGSSGVHELGTNTEYKTPNREGIIPTLSLIGNSIENGFEKTMEIVKQANEYYTRYLE